MALAVGSVGAAVADTTDLDGSTVAVQRVQSMGALVAGDEQPAVLN